ncbi:hypothetical protein L1987_61631 [Smallanthus sonchifolius]|uniref:Uncharacterized protein n=1 Tax=Smallanthus sonchifolius TaxID=185202 RepID=A0ACB9C868_9ASTR|nr:hypothetical protein L1987_61631 [Smallanthus sonchifolius]
MARPDQQPQSHPQTQIQLPEIPQTEDHSQVVILNNSESQTSHTPILAVQVFAIVSLTVRVATWLCLLASLIVLASNTSNIKDLYTDVKVGFNNIYAYRYMMSAIVIGFAYTCVLVPFEIYQLAMGKSLVTGNWLSKTIFYGDKFLLSLLATGVGAAFGATFDLKRSLDQLDDSFESYGIPYLSDYRSKLDNFFNMAYVSAGFLLIAFLTSVASSILSSLSLQKN